VPNKMILYCCFSFHCNFT